MLVIFWLAEALLAVEEGLCTKEMVGLLVGQLVIQSVSKSVEGLLAWLEECNIKSYP